MFVLCALSVLAFAGLCNGRQCGNEGVCANTPSCYRLNYYLTEPTEGKAGISTFYYDCCSDPKGVRAIWSCRAESNDHHVYLWMNGMGYQSDLPVLSDAWGTANSAGLGNAETPVEFFCNAERGEWVIRNPDLDTWNMGGMNVYLGIKNLTCQTTYSAK